jgi:UDPglucose 6-dehydrogenase
MTDKNYRVGIIGYGVVGRGIHKLLKDDVKAVYDPYIDHVEGVGRDKSDFINLDLIVISVMTKENEDGSCDISIVKESLDWAYEQCPNAVFLIKSAVVPSEIAKFIGMSYIAVDDGEEYDYSIKLVVSPEYMGESKYFTPFWKYPDPKNMESHTWQIFGGDKKDTSLCVDIFKRRMSVDCIHLQTDIMTAALCKYMENSFFALKVTFCNEWFDIAETYGVDYNELRECWLADTRINRNHTLVFPKDRGYGGKCFPKDVKAIVKDVQNLGYKAELMDTVSKVNEKFRRYNG